MKLIGEEIYQIIPNRKPLMLLDSIEISDGKAVSEIKLIENEWFFACHYPGYPIFPLSLLLECMTQTFSAIFLVEEGNAEIPVISSIGELKLKESAKPGDMLRIEANLASFKRGIAKGICKVYKNDGKDSILETEIVEVLPSKMVRIS